MTWFLFCWIRMESSFSAIINTYMLVKKTKWPISSWWPTVGGLARFEKKNNKGVKINGAVWQKAKKYPKIAIFSNYFGPTAPKDPLIFFIWGCSQNSSAPDRDHILERGIFDKNVTKRVKNRKSGSFFIFCIT